MKIAVAILILALVASWAFAVQPTPETTVQLSDTQDADGNWINPVVIVVVWDEATRDEIPPHDPFDYDINQHWNIAYKLKFYGFSFDREVIGKYALRVSFDGVRYGEEYGVCENKLPDAPIHQ